MSLRDGFAHDVASAEHNAFLARGFDVVVLQQCQDAKRRGGDEAGQADGHASDIDGMEAVDILAVVDGHDDFLFVDVLWQRQVCTMEAIDVSVFVEPVDAGQQLLFRDVVLIADECRLESALFACDDLVLDVGLRAAVVAHEHSGQMRLLLSVGNHLLNLFCNLLLYGCGSCLSINQCHSYVCYLFLHLRHVPHHVAHTAACHHFHHLTGLVKLLDESVDLLNAGAGTFCDAHLAALIEHFWVGALLGCHAADDGLDAVEGIVVDVDILDGLAHAWNHRSEAL